MPGIHFCPVAERRVAGFCIIDPTKVVRTALENAVSVASVLLLTEATVTDIPEDKNQLGQEHFTEV